MKIYRSGEDYLEAILRLTREKGYARSTDVAELVGVSKPSVSNAMHTLEEGGFITFGGDRMIHLTAAGREVAERVYERHCLLTEGLVSLGVDPAVAEEDACRIEHDISEESFDKLRDVLRRRLRKDEAE